MIQRFTGLILLASLLLLGALPDRASAQTWSPGQPAADDGFGTPSPPDLPSEVLIADIDGDGINDMVVTSEGDDSVYWYAGSSDGIFGQRRNVLTNFTNLGRLTIIDWDGDGDPDVIAPYGNGVVLATNRGLGSYSASVLIFATGSDIDDVAVDDFNLDGRLDIATVRTNSSTGELAWYPKQNIGFGSKQVITTNIPGNPGRAELSSAEVFNTGGPDLIVAVSGSTDEILVFSNSSGTGFGGSPGSRRGSGDWSSLRHLFTWGGFPGGGVRYLVATNAGVFLYYFDGVQSVREVISTTSARYAVARDVDGDGDRDVVYTNQFGVFWAQNTGSLQFAAPRSIGAYFATGVEAGDMDDDGDVDILGTAQLPDAVFLHENRPPQASIQLDEFLFSITLNENESTTRTFNITNRGAANLTYSVALAGPAIPNVQFDPESGTLVTRQGAEVTVAVDATGLAPGNYSYDIVVSSNDPDRPEAQIDISLEVVDVDDPPVAENDVYAALQNTTLDVSGAEGVFANDSDPDASNAPSLSVTQNPSNGTLTSFVGGATDATLGAFTYVPDTDFLGVDTFEYEILDDQGLTDRATVTITVQRPGPIVVDGESFESAYLPLAASPAVPGGTFTGGVVFLKAYSGADSLYIALDGRLSTGPDDAEFEEMILFVDASSVTGIPEGDPLPPASEPLSPFSALDGMVMDMEADFGIRITGGSARDAYVSITDYVSTTNGTAPDAFEVALFDFRGRPYNGTSGATYAYQDSPTLTDVSGTGFEMAIPYSAFGTTSSDQYRFFAFYGNMEENEIAATLLPDDGTDNLYGNSENWNVVSGVQATAGQALPVELSSFDVMISGETALLEWTTASETNNAGFTVQQAVGDNPFRDIGFVDGAGTSQTVQRYRFEAERLAVGTHQFRLKQVDTDGTFAYSRTETVRVMVTDSYQIVSPSPNPTSGRALLRLAVREAQQVRVDVYDLLGRRVGVVFEGAVSAQTQQSIPLGDGLAAGSYFVRVTGETFRTTERLVVVR